VGYSGRLIGWSAEGTLLRSSRWVLVGSVRRERGWRLGGCVAWPLIVEGSKAPSDGFLVGQIDMSEIDDVDSWWATREL
jgi:hypothetical protein